MISRAFIKQWSHGAPWRQMYQVEHDLIISRALVELFNRAFLAENLAFRGGMALFKLYLAAVRCSEDTDLVGAARSHRFDHGRHTGAAQSMARDCKAEAIRGTGHADLPDGGRGRYTVQAKD